jgi:hypothetical protein
MQNSSHARLDVLQGSLTPNCVSFYVDEKKKEKEKKRKKLFYLYCTNSTRLREEVSLSLAPEENGKFLFYLSFYQALDNLLFLLWRKQKIISSWQLN